MSSFFGPSFSRSAPGLPLLAQAALAGAVSLLALRELRRRRRPPAELPRPAIAGEVRVFTEDDALEDAGDYLVFDLYRDDHGCKVELVEGQLTGEADMSDIVGQAALAAYANGLIVVGQG